MTLSSDLIRAAYPPIEPYASGMLDVDSRHSLYWELCGNPQGKPVVFLHGGPGAGCEAGHRQLFDPAKYRILLFDQRGAGRSTPQADVTDNTTWRLVEDIERLRVMLQVEAWQVVGGSWGATLGLCYAQTHPQRVTEMVLEGIALVRGWELQWFYQEGASRLFPDRSLQLLSILASPERADLVAAYHERLTSGSPALRLEAAKASSLWDLETSTLLPDPQSSGFEEARQALAMARIEGHYLVNGAFFPTDNHLLENIDRNRHIPATIVHGRNDRVCPVQNAWDLAQAWPEATLNIVEGAGRSVEEPTILSAVIDAVDGYAARRV